MNKEDFCEGARPGPLNGVLVVSCERLLSAPYCTKLLWEMGATVVKVEPPEGEVARGLPPFHDDKSVYFARLNHGKKSIALDLSTETDRELFRELIRRADVFVENVTPDDLDRHGLDSASLKQLNPALIQASLSAFGRGEASPQVVHDVVMQAMSGLISVTGFEHEPPVKVGPEIGDISGGTFTAIAIVAALFDRLHTGDDGLVIDVSLLDSVVSLLETAFLNYSFSGVVPKPKQNRDPAASPFDLYQCRDKKIAIVCANQSLWESLLEAIDGEDLLSDPRFADNAKRSENADALKVELEKLLANTSAADAIETLMNAGVPVSPVNHVSELFGHPQVEARQMIAALDTPDYAGVSTTGNPVKLSEYPEASATRPAPPSLDGDRAPVEELASRPSRA